MNLKFETDFLALIMMALAGNHGQGVMMTSAWSCLSFWFSSNRPTDIDHGFDDPWLGQGLVRPFSEASLGTTFSSNICCRRAVGAAWVAVVSPWGGILSHGPS